MLGGLKRLLMAAAAVSLSVGQVRHRLFEFTTSNTCAASSSGVLNFVGSLGVPVNASGIQMSQLAFGMFPGGASPQTITVIGGGKTVTIPTSVMTPCCAANGCDLATAAGGAWFESNCGAPAGCSLRWMMAPMTGSVMGTCPGCGMPASGSVTLDVQFANGIGLANFGTGTSFYMSYYGMGPPSVTPSPSTSASVSPSLSASPSNTKSVTPTVSMGICAQAQLLVWGDVESVSGDTQYTITHGANITHVYNPAPLLVGTNPSCVGSFGACTCTFTAPGSAGCVNGRTAVVIYKIGGSGGSVTTFNRQNPACTYYFDTWLSYVSASPSVSPSVSGSVTVSVSVSGSVTVSASVSGSVTGSPSVTRSRTASRSVTRSRTASPSISLTGTPEFLVSRWPSATATGTANATRTPAFAVTAWPTRGFTGTGTSTPLYMLLPIPSASGSAAAAAASESEEAVKSRTVATAVGGAAVGAVGMGIVGMIVQNLRPQQQQDDNRREDEENNEREDERRRRRRSNDDEEEEEEEDNSGNRVRLTEEEERDDEDMSGNSFAPQASRHRMRSDSEETRHTVIFAFRPEDIIEVRGLLVRNGVTYTENPHLL